MKTKTKFDKKAIRNSILLQIERDCPFFNRLKRREKRRVLQKLCDATRQAMKEESLQLPSMSQSELLGLGPIPKGIMSLEEMKSFVEDHKRTVFRLDSPTRKRAIHDPVLRFLDEMLDDHALDFLLAPPGMTPSKRQWMPSRLLRIELLRTARFGMWSVRDFCKYISSLERKEERAFCRLPLHKLEMCDHSRLSTFRSSLTFEMRVNLMVYMIHHFMASGRLGKKLVHMMDSTDISMPINDTPIEKLKMPDSSFIRFYSDLLSDAGARRRKRNKSNKFIGYRMHTICVGDMESGIAFPLLSLAISANHSDSLMLVLLAELAQSLGLDIKVMAVDEGYLSAPNHQALRCRHGIISVVKPSKIAVCPDHVDPKKGTVFATEVCETPMRWRGFDTNEKAHVFTCNSENSSCMWSSRCPKERLLPMDTGFFGTVPWCDPAAKRVVDARKITERPFNLMKHFDGLEPCRMRNHRTMSAQIVFSQMIGIANVLAGQRGNTRKPKPKRQEVLSLAIAN